MKWYSYLFFLMFFAQVNAQPIVEIPLGSSGNQQTNSHGVYTNLWYDADIHTVMFSHRSNDLAGWPSTGNILYDFSIDDGLNWWTDRGPVYFDSLNFIRARFPQGVIYNPPGNTNPQNAFFTTFGAATDGIDWSHYSQGTVEAGNTLTFQFTYDCSYYNLMTSIPQSGMLVKNTGTTWWSAARLDSVVYADTIILSKGHFFSIGYFNYSFKKVHIPVCTDVDGKKMFFNQAVAFNDGGDIGYIAVIGNDWVCSSQPSDSAMGVIVYQTADSGSTWNRIAGISLSALDPLLLNNGSLYQAGDRFDIGVDKHNNLHIGLPVVPFLPGNAVASSYPQGSIGLFDITLNASTGSSDACLLSHVKSYYGGNPVSPDTLLLEDNRIQFSRSWDGSKIFFTWFDTDTAFYATVLNNYPDMHSIGYDVDQNLWTSDFNFTAGTGLLSDGKCRYGNVSYYTINDGTNENIPAVFDTLEDLLFQPPYFYYIGGAAVSGYSNAGNCIQLINKIPENNFTAFNFFVSSAYPNPFSKKASLDIVLEETSDVVLEIVNVMGQKFPPLVYKNVRPGKSTLAIEGSSLPNGLYFVVIRAGEETKTRMMCVE